MEDGILKYGSHLHFIKSSMGERRELHMCSLAGTSSGQGEGHRHVALP